MPACSHVRRVAGVTPGRWARTPIETGTSGAGFHEIVLVDERETTIERFHRRARDSDDAWIRHHHRLVARAGGSTVLGIMYDNLMEVVRLRPGAVLVPSVVDEVQATYASLVEALGSTEFDG